MQKNLSKHFQSKNTSPPKSHADTRQSPNQKKDLKFFDVRTTYIERINNLMIW